MPEMNGPSGGAVLTVSDRVAGTEPEAPVWGTVQPPQAIESRPSIDDPLLVIAPDAVSIVTRLVAPPKSLTTPYMVRPSHEKSADEISAPDLIGEPVMRTPLATAPVCGLSVYSEPKSPSSAPHSQPL